MSGAVLLSASVKSNSCVEAQIYYPNPAAFDFALKLVATDPALDLLYNHKTNQQSHFYLCM